MNKFNFPGNNSTGEFGIIRLFIFIFIIIFIVVSMFLYFYRDSFRSEVGKRYSRESDESISRFGVRRDVAGIPTKKQRRDIEGSRFGERPTDFLGGATELNRDAAAYLGINIVRSEKVSEVIPDARDKMTNLVLSRIRENFETESTVDLNRLASMVSTNTVNITGEEALKLIAGSYTIPALKNEAAEIETALRSELVALIGLEGELIADEVKQHREFMKFGRDEINLVRFRNKGLDSYSVYLEFRTPETGQFNGASIIPFAPFNKRFGNFFAE